ncbi:MAG: AraC family transcriptional regulator [Eubacteriales bacterium]|jgi:AraC-like DNA-binding protein|nr:AraC family transcriptional regulator [Eubacteriales bacterium]MDD3503154.1 AraC family transcriptional regulator [Eubacteriales bacterium]MDD4683459.1 AraC family transcriptional regulator [Eubacteriales bacterium]
MEDNIECLLQIIWTNYKLSSYYISEGVISAEYSNSHFARRIIHNFLSDNSLIKKDKVLYFQNLTMGIITVYLEKLDAFCVFGPYLRVRFDINNSENLYYYTDFLRIPSKMHSDFFNFFSTLPCLSEPVAYQCAADVFKLFSNKESTHPTEIIHYGFGKDNFTSFNIKANFKTISTDREFSVNNDQENLKLNEAKKNENTIMSLIEAGDPEGLRNFVRQQVFTIHTGILKDSMKNARYTTISFMAVASRAAAKAGLEFHHVQHTLDLYIAYLDKLNSIDEILSLTYDISLEYAIQVRDARIPSNVLPAIRQSLIYIQNNICKKLSLQELASYVNMTKTYYSRIFSKEIKMTVTEYITKRKIEEAKKLLQYSDLSLTDVSDRLSFSSQNYFQNIFRRYTGITPGEYRRNNKQ